MSISSTTVEPPQTITPLQQPLFLVPADSPYIHSYFNLSTTVSCPQRRRPLKLVLMTAKITSRQQPVNREWINDWRTVYTEPHCFACKRWPDSICTARAWFLFSFCFIDIVWFIYAKNKQKCERFHTIVEVLDANTCRAEYYN